jgi:hypothetical protein
MSSLWFRQVLCLKAEYTPHRRAPIKAIFFVLCKVLVRMPGVSIEVSGLASAR